MKLRYPPIKTLLVAFMAIIIAMALTGLALVFSTDRMTQQVVVSATQYAQPPLARATQVALAVIVFVHCVGLLMVVVVYRLIADLVQAIEAFAGRVEHGEFAAQFSTDAGGEARTVALVLNKMVERLNAAIGSQTVLRNRLEFLLSAAPVMLYAGASREGSGVALVSANVLQQLGYAAQDFTGNPGFWVSKVHPDDIERVIASRKLASGSDKHTCEYRFLHQDGSWRWMHDETVQTPDIAGVPGEFVGYWIDISEQKEMQQSLLRRDAILAAVAYGSEHVLRAGEETLAAQWQLAVQAVLAHLGEATGVSRIWIAQNAQTLPDDASALPIYHWALPEFSLAADHPWLTAGFSPQQQGLGVEAVRLRRGELVQLHTSELSEPLRTLFAAPTLRICSQLLLPITVGGVWWGVMIFDDCDAERHWHESELEALRTAANSFGAALGARLAQQDLRNNLKTLGSTLEKLNRQSAEIARQNEELAQLSKRLDVLLKTTPAVIYAVNAYPINTGGDYATTFISENVHHMLGYAAQDFTGDPGCWQRNVHPEDIERVLAEQQSVLDRGGASREYRFRHQDGSWRWMHDESTLIRDATGAPQELVGYWIDITARKQAEEELRQSTQLMSSIIDNMPAMLIVKRASDLRFERINCAGERLLGYSRNDLLGKTAYDFFPAEQAGFFSAEDRKVLATHEVSEIAELPITTASGEIRYLSSRKIALHNAVGEATHLLSMSLDITERKRVQEALERADAELARQYQLVQQASQAKSEFMANVTHELRTPLNAVIGFAELLGDQVPGPLNAQQLEFAGDILSSGLRLAKLVDGILEMSRLDAADSALEREPVDIGCALRDCVGAHQQTARQRRISVAVEVTPNGGSAQLDPKALRRMLDVLLDNAIKFNVDGGTVLLKAQRVTDAIEVAVTDSGIGIAPEHLGKLFKPMVQLDGSLSRQHGGIGIGLALARRLAELHGGSIEVQSEPGKGSTFTLRLPVGETA